MSKIFKASNINMDTRNKFFVEVQNLPDINFFQLNKKDSDYHFSDGNQKDDNDQTDEEKILNKAKSDAEKIIKKAEVDATRIHLDVKAQCEKLKEETESKAYKKGYEEGYGKSVAEAETIKTQAAQILADAEIKRQKTLDDIEPQMVDLILRITTKLLNDSIELKPQTIMNLIKQGLMESTITGDIVIHVSNDDFDVVTENKDAILSMVGGGTNIEIIKDFTINKSDCIIETPFGNIDCSLDQQFENLKHNIYYIFENK